MALHNVGKALYKMRAHDITISSDVPHDLRSGRPRIALGEVAIGGVAVYFKRSGREHVMASDTWIQVAHNLQAVAKAMEAMLIIERCGAANILDKAFVGLRMLPPHLTAGPWTEVLGVSGDATEKEAKQAYRDLAIKYHPDTCGTHETMVLLTAAYEQALKDIRRRESRAAS